MFKRDFICSRETADDCENLTPCNYCTENGKKCMKVSNERESTQNENNRNY